MLGGPVAERAAARVGRTPAGRVYPAARSGYSLRQAVVGDRRGRSFIELTRVKEANMHGSSSHPASTPGSGAGPMPAIDFDDRPFLVIWETTQACDLACKHCRAEAIPDRDPGELSTEEGKALLDEVAAMGTPIFILSGGDPLRRPDLEELIRYGKEVGLRMGTIPAATPALTRERIEALGEAGVDQVAFSIDGPTERIHDAFRGVDGSFAKTLEGVRFAHDAGIPVQINTCFASWNFAYLEAMIELVKSLGVVFWEVFFLVPTGRGREMQSLKADQFEQAFERLLVRSLRNSGIMRRRPKSGSNTSWPVPAASQGSVCPRKR